MTVEYILLITAFFLIVIGSVISGPQGAFDRAGPKLGARVEKHLMTGDGFASNGRGLKWEEN